MKCVFMVVLCSCLILGCGCRQPMCQQGNASQQIRVDKDGNIPDECVEFKIFPYRELPEKCFGGKSHFNQELSASKRGIICPYGPVTRTMRRDKSVIYRTSAIYDIYVEVTLDSAVQKVSYCTKTIYERTNDRVTMLLLTDANPWDWKERSLRVEEIHSDKYAESANRKLDEGECIVLFNSRGIYIKSAGDIKFRGYL